MYKTLNPKPYRQKFMCRTSQRIAGAMVIGEFPDR